MSEEHTCQAVVLHCIDFRFTHDIDRYLAERFRGGYDVISVAGACKNLLEEGARRDFLLEQFQVSNRLHHPKTILLLQHEDCGAYGGSAALGSEEADFQRQQLAQAVSFLKKQFPESVLDGRFMKLSKEIVEG